MEFLQVLGHQSYQVAIFMLLGLGMECLFTGVSDGRREWKSGKCKHMWGFSSVLYIVVYGIAPLMFWLLRPVFAWNWIWRGLVYMFVIYIAEYSWMWTLRKWLGSSPSEENYKKSGRSIHDLVRWDFAPAWYVAGLFMEYTYKVINHIV